MQAPLGKPTLEIRSVRLAKDDPGLRHSGQEAGGGRVRPVDSCGLAREGEEPGPAEEGVGRRGGGACSAGDFGYCKYGGYLNTKAKATGFFRVEQVDGRWWFVDPDGHLFFSTSSTGIGSGGGDARLQGREDYFTALPPVEAAPAPGRRPQTGFYAWNLARRHGAESKTKWIDLALRRLESWGLNTIGNWSDSRLWDAHRKAYVVNLRGLGHGDGLHGDAGRVLRRVPEDRRQGGRRAVRAAQGRSLPAGVLHRQRTAVAGPGVAGGGHHSGAAAERDPARGQGLSGRAATHRSGASSSSTARSTSTWK